MLGIDTSKATLQCSLRDPVTQCVLWDLDVANSESGVATLLKKAPSGVDWVIEPTGRYSVSVVRQAQAAGRTVLLAPPRKAKDYLRSLQSRAKTDKLDARGLALFGLSRPLAEYPVKEEALDAIDQLLSARKGLSNSITRLQLQSNELPSAKEVLDKAIALLKTEVRDLDKLIAGRTATEPKMAVAKELRKVPGIGAVTSAAVSSRLANKRFAHPDQFVAYVGLDIEVHDSGTRKGKRGLTHQGDAELRRLLYCCAQASLRAKDSPFLMQYKRELAKGLPTTAALCAVARKMAKLCWALFTHETKYDPDRVYTSPPRGRHAVSAGQQTPVDPEKSTLDHETLSQIEK
jgi:transposase